MSLEENFGNIQAFSYSRGEQVNNADFHDPNCTRLCYSENNKSAPGRNDTMKGKSQEKGSWSRV